MKYKLNEINVKQIEIGLFSLNITGYLNKALIFALQ